MLVSQVALLVQHPLILLVLLNQRAVLLSTELWNGCITCQVRVCDYGRPAALLV